MTISWISGGLSACVILTAVLFALARKLTSFNTGQPVPRWFWLTIVVLACTWPWRALAYFLAFLDRTVLGDWLPRASVAVLQSVSERTTAAELQEGSPGFYALAVCLCIVAVMSTLLMLPV